MNKKSFSDSLLDQNWDFIIDNSVFHVFLDIKADYNRTTFEIN